MKFPKEKIDKQLLLFKICGRCGDILPSDDNSGVAICCSCLGKMIRHSFDNFVNQIPIIRGRYDKNI